MMVKNTFKGFLSSIYIHRRSIFVLFEALWLLLIWVISPFVSDGFALIISPIAAIAVSLAMLPGISYIYSILKKKDLFDPKMASFVLYGISYLLTLYLTVVLLEKCMELADKNSHRVYSKILYHPIQRSDAPIYNFGYLF